MNIAIVTGASSGMGREFAIRLCGQYAYDELWVVARREQELASLQNEVSCPVRVLALDLTEPDSLERFRLLLAEQKPNVRLLANIAGFGRFGSYESIPLSDSLQMIDLNVKALVSVTELTLPYMERGSVILQWDSMSAFFPVPNINVYGSTKAFVLHYSRALNVELKPRGIRVLAVCPYWVQTAFFDGAIKTNRGEVGNYDKIYTTRQITDRVMRALERKKQDVFVPGLYAKTLRALLAVLPHSLAMRTWLRMQRKRG